MKNKPMFNIYIGDKLLMSTSSYNIACKHARAGKKVVMVSSD